MKNIKLFVSMLAVAAMFASCGKDDTDSSIPEITISPSELSMDSKSGQQTVTVQANRPWKVTSDATWLAFDPSSGTGTGKAVKVTVTTLANTSYNRTASVKFDMDYDYKTLKVNQTGDLGEDKTATPSGSGTNADPFNIAAAVEKANALTAFSSGDSQTSSNSLAAYVKGKISKITGVDTSYGNATYYISDGGSQEIEVYRGYYLGGVKFTSADQIKVGDEVIVYGTLVNFKGDTPEFTTGSKLVYLNGTSAETTDYSKATAKTVAEFIKAADENTYYKLTGTVSAFSSSYCSFDLTDASGKIYVFSVDNKADWVSKISNGGTVVLAGKYKYYTAKSQHEVVNAYILSFTEGSQPEVTTKTITEIIALDDATSVKTENALVVAKGKTSFVATDGTSNILVYGSTAAEAVAAGDKVTITATKTTYGTVPELKDPTVTVTSQNNTVTTPAVKDITSTFDSYAPKAVEYISFKGTMSISTSGTSTYYNVAVAGASSKTGSISGPLVALGADDCNGKVVTVTGYFAGFSGSDKYLNIVATKIAVDETAKTFAVSPATLTAESSATSATFTVSSNVAWTASCDNAAFTLDKTSGTGDATVTVTFAANTGSASKVANITVSTTADVSTKSYKVVLTQSGLVSSTEYTTNVTWTNVKNANSDGKATVNGVADVAVYKLGTASAAGSATVNLKKGTKKVNFYGVSWKSKAATLDIQIGGTSVGTQALAANDGATSTSPYTMTVSSSDKYTFDITKISGMSEGLTSDMDITLTTTGTNYRVILFGIQAE